MPCDNCPDQRVNIGLILYLAAVHCTKFWLNPAQKQIMQTAGKPQRHCIPDYTSRPVGNPCATCAFPLRKRDHLDTTRMTAPLQIALGAEVLDSTHLSIDDVVKRILERVRAARRRPTP